MRKTKIVATLGPVSHTYETIYELIEAGMDVARLNFSHGTHQDHKKTIELIRKASAILKKPVAILQDLQGPKIRTGKLKDGKSVDLVKGQSFFITTRDIVGDAKGVSTSYKSMADDVKPGCHIFLSDGLIDLNVLEVKGQDVICEVLHGGNLGEHQGINLPGSNISSPSVTEKDLEDLHYGLKQDIDYVAISFVRKPQDVLDVKNLIKEKGLDIPVVAKLERQEAIDNLEAILDVADVVMVARGDLGVELPPEQVPLLQKRIIREANERAVPVITATQMLDSMISHPRPTRAETSDVANAILDGSDAVMLSGESANGMYPLESVQMMAKIAEFVETNTPNLNQHKKRFNRINDKKSVACAIGAAVNAIENDFDISAIWVHTMTGSTAKLISHFRPKPPTYAFTPNVKILNRLCLLWGIIPFKTDFYDNYQAFEKSVYPVIKERDLAKNGDVVVMTGGFPIGNYGPTNFLKIETLKDL